MNEELQKEELPRKKLNETEKDTKTIFKISRNINE